MAKNNSPNNKLAHGDIAAVAFQMYEMEGRPHGKDREHWNQAELLLLSLNFQDSSKKEEQVKTKPARGKD